MTAFSGPPLVRDGLLGAPAFWKLPYVSAVTIDCTMVLWFVWIETGGIKICLERFIRVAVRIERLIRVKVCNKNSIHSV